VIGVVYNSVRFTRKDSDTFEFEFLNDGNIVYTSQDIILQKGDTLQIKNQMGIIQILESLPPIEKSILGK